MDNRENVCVCVCVCVCVRASAANTLAHPATTQITDHAAKGFTKLTMHRFLPHRPVVGPVSPTATLLIVYYIQASVAESSSEASLHVTATG